MVTLRLLFPVVLVVISASFTNALAQPHQSSVDFSIGGANSEGCISTSFSRDWSLGGSDRFYIGSGIRLNAYLGKNRYYVTAPAKLTSGKKGPRVLFIENIPENMDTLLLKNAQVNSVNLFLNLAVRFNAKFSAGFDIDVIGFSFGARTKGNYINGVQGSIQAAKVSSFNLLLISDNDRGMLNSELYVKYAVHNRIDLKGGAQFLFSEYTTDSFVQQLPEPNNRFRKKSLMIFVGLSLKLKDR
jgi:hypothetical protein